jgi:murein DD-endopeptidase MepM/ murein hydrolase activator NlpD
MHVRPLGSSHVVFWLSAVLSGAAVSVLAQSPSNPGPATLSVGSAPASLKPGSVALLTVSATQDLTELTGKAAGHPVFFWPSSPREWSGLVGISLEAAPGPLAVTIQGKTAGGAMPATRLSVLVEKYQFATRRLEVDPKLANPPAEELARIKEEAKAMADAFAIVTPERLWRGPFEAPVPGTATSSFGRLTITNGKPAGRHQGADFRAATGTPVRAPNAGRVVIAKNLYFAGNTVIIDHGFGVFSLLAHLSRIGVDRGATVARGDVLGESGATGRVTGPHLHWAVRFGEMSVDPLALMSASAAQSVEDVPRASR